ncbi:MAG: MFS transporter [Planctomycetota bacterium]|nr:MFS transporter [Planctomycetota bacterium]
MPARRHASLLAMISALHGATHLYWVLLPPLNTEIMDYFGLTLDRQITFVQTAFLVVYACSNLASGFLATRVAPRKLLALSPLLNGACVAAMYFLAPNQYWGLVGLHALGAAFGGFYHPVANLTLTSLFPHAKGKAIGIAGIGASVAFLVAPWSASALVHHAGWTWQHVMLLYGGAGMACGALAWFVLPAGALDHEEGLGALRPVAALPAATMRSVWLFVALCVFVIGGRELGSWGTTAITRQFLDKAFAGGEAPDAGFLLTMLFLPGLVIQPLAGLWSDKVDRERLVGVTLLGMALALYLLPRVDRAWIVVPFMLAGGSMQANVPVFEAMISDRTPLRVRGLVFGVLITLGIAIGSVGPYLVGWIADAGLNTTEAYAQAFTALAAMCLACGLGSVILKPAARRLGLTEAGVAAEAVAAPDRLAPEA